MTIHHESPALNSRHEHDGNYEELNKKFLRVALDQYFHRYEEAKRYHYFQKGKLDRYSQSEAEKDEREALVAFSSAEANHAKLETLGDIETGPAGLTVTIPVAVLSEDFDSLKHTLEEITKAQERMGQPVNVVIWANAFYKGIRQEKKVVGDAKSRFETMKNMLRDFSTDNVRIRPALATYKGKVHMANVRKDYMEATGLMLAEEGNGFMHPVLWLDADTSHLSKDAFSGIKHAVEKGETLYPHLRLKFMIDWTDAPLSQADNATKAVAVDEINRRLAYRGHDDKGYYEESGFACAIGTYLSSGGLNSTYAGMPTPAISETNTLLQRTLETAKIRSSLQGIENSEGIKGWNIIPQELITSDGPTKLTGYLDRASIGTSARRMYRRVRQGGAVALLQYGNQLFNQLDDRKTARDVNATDMHLLVNSEFSNRPHVTGRRERIARKVIQRYFP